MHLPHAEDRHGTTLGVFGVLLLFVIALLVSVHAPPREDDNVIHNAAAVAW